MNKSYQKFLDKTYGKTIEHDPIKKAFDKYQSKKEESLLQKTEEKKPFYKRPLVWIAGLGGFFLVKGAIGKLKNNLVTVEGKMRLTPDFYVRDFLVSKTIPEIKNYKLTNEELTNLTRHARLLQMISNDLGSKLIIISGGRPRGIKAETGDYKGMTFVEALKAQNRSPSEFSQHMDFSASDFTAADKSDLIRIMNLVRTPNYDRLFRNTITQIILYVKKGKPNFIHLGTRSDIYDFKKIIKPINKILLSSNNMYLPFTKDNLNQLLA